MNQPESDNSISKLTGDMPVEEFKKYGHQLIDWIAEYLTEIEKYPVVPNLNPGEIKKNLNENPPLKGEDFNSVLSDLDKIIVPGITHWNHPNFMAYFNSTSSSPGILAELLIAAFNMNGMIWKTSPVSTELEPAVLNWLRDMLSIPKNFWGIIYDTASVSSMHAIAAAREQLSNLQLRQKGMAGRNDVPKLRLYCSEHAHSSIEKGAITLGIGIDGIRKINVDEIFRMIPGELQKAIEEDKKNGWLPFCAVATIGTTSTTSIDPLKEIAKICNENNIWLHVDAAYGGTAAVLPEMKYIFEGLENADSIVVNPHKWMFTPIDLSAFYTKKPEILKRAFSLIPEYLKTNVDNTVENYMDYGVQLGRRFRALKLWFIIRYFGVEGIQNRIREHINLAKKFSGWLKGDNRFEILAPVPFSVICFRYHPKDVKDENQLNKLNEKLLNKINETGELFLSHTKLNGKFTIRIAISGLRTEERHVKKAWELIQNKANLLEE